jgi:DNA polymerase elongation subunit (family B)
MDDEKPEYISGYNSDAFDWMHIEHRLESYGKSLSKWFDAELVDKNFDGFYKRCVVFKRDGCMMCDGIDWMIRDSYLSKGNKKLKKATEILLKVIAMETDHEQHAIDSLKYETFLLEKIPDLDYNSDLSDEQNQMYEEAYKHFWRFATYCASDTFITDIFVTNTIINMNLALSMLVPYNVWKVSRYPRGKQCFLKLAELMNGWGITGDAFSGFLKYDINPSKQKMNDQEVKFIYQKDIDGQKETLFASWIT